MKSQLLSALAVVGVIGTATTAYAANTELLGGVDNQAFGNSSETTVTNPPINPTQQSRQTPEPEPGPISSSEPNQGVAATPPTQKSFSVVPAPAVAPAIEVDATTGGSGMSVDYDDEDDHDEDDHDEDDHDEDDHDEDDHDD